MQPIAAEYEQANLNWCLPRGLTRSTQVPQVAPAFAYAIITRATHAIASSKALAVMST